MSVLDEHRAIWAAKPSLARLYREEFFARIDRWTTGATVVEVGAGPGLYKQSRPDLLAIDIMDAPWLDVRADGLALPLRSASTDAIVGVDVIHHFVQPIRFLEEVERVLRPGGRLVLVEPWRTALSQIIYTHAHQEDFDLGWSPADPGPATGDDPFDGNQAIPFLVFDRYWDGLQADRLRGLRRVHVERFSFVSYLLSGGFRKANLLPGPLYAPVVSVERWTAPVWRRWAALRALVVIERAGPDR